MLAAVEVLERKIHVATGRDSATGWYEVSSAVIAMAPVGSTSHTSVKTCSKSHQNRLMNERKLEKLLRTVVDTSVSCQAQWNLGYSMQAVM